MSRIKGSNHTRQGVGKQREESVLNILFPKKILDELLIKEDDLDSLTSVNFLKKGLIKFPYLDQYRFYLVNNFEFKGEYIDSEFKCDHYIIVSYEKGFFPINNNNNRKVICKPEIEPIEEVIQIEGVPEHLLDNDCLCYWDNEF